MVKNNRRMNSEINVIEIIWRFLEQWKAVLLFSLVIALLFSFIVYIKDTKESGNHNEQVITIDDSAEVDENIANILDSLNDQDRSSVENIMKEKKLLDIKEAYLKNSLVQKIDPDNCRQIQLQFKVDAEDEFEKGALIEAYESSLMSDDSVTFLAETIDPKLNSKYIYELFLPGERENSSKHSTLGDTDETLVVEMLVPDDVDATDLRDTLKEVILNQKNEISEKVGKHDITLISEKVIHYSDIDRAYDQTNAITQLTDARNNYNKNYALLSEQQRNTYNLIASLEDKDGSELHATKTENPKISVKTIGIGIILGVLIYGLILGLLLLIRRRIISETDTAYYPGVRTIYSFVNKENPKGLFRSVVIEKIRNRKPLPLEEQVRACSDVLSLICEREEMSNLTLLSPGTLESECNQLIKEVCANLNRLGINASIIELDNASFEIEDRTLVEEAPIIPVIVEDITSLKGFNDLMNTCAYYKISVIGTIYYRGR